MRVLKKDRPLERVLESRCVKFARTRGWLARKMNGLGYVSWCDRLFIPPRKTLDPVVVWVEFKRLGDKPTKLQTLHHKELRARGQHVFVVDNFIDFVNVINEYENRNPPF